MARGVFVRHDRGIADQTVLGIWHIDHFHLKIQLDTGVGLPG